MKVTYKSHMLSDLDVVNAARVSFSKTSDWDTREVHENSSDCAYIYLDSSLKPADEKLIKYLAEHNHWTPFSHPQLSVHIKAPIFVRSQLFKHKVGLTENEISRRYVDAPPEVYIPKEWRGKPVNKKQGSSDEVIEDPYLTNYYGSFCYGDLIDMSVHWYHQAIDAGIAPEMARMILPQATYTEWIWTGSLAAFARVCNLRCAEDAQQETKEIADQLAQILHSYWPVSAKYLLKGN